MVEGAARGGQTLAMVPALAKLLDEGIARGEGQPSVATGVPFGFPQPCQIGRHNGWPSRSLRQPTSVQSLEW
jgi:hypothetical protein